MAGMEELEIHSKSYLVRWVNVLEGHTISWSVQPHKKSINFGVLKHPGYGDDWTQALSINLISEDSLQKTLSPTRSGLNNRNAALSTSTTFAKTVHVSNPSVSGSSAHTTSIGTTNKSKRLSSSRSQSDPTELWGRLANLGLRTVAWTGRCEADKVSTGKYNVPQGEGGMYGLVLDNTRSKAVSKMVTIVLMTYPISMPPTNGYHLLSSQAMNRRTLRSSTNAKQNLTPGLEGNLPALSLQHVEPPGHVPLGRHLPTRQRSESHPTKDQMSVGATLFTGILFKKRRKRNQGYARRFFSLDFASSTLSYYKNQNCSALRGVIPLVLAAVGTNEKERRISIDSGVEIWLLRAQNEEDFRRWIDALAQACQAATSPGSSVVTDANNNQILRWSAADEREWSTIELLVGRIAGIRDAMRRLVKVTNPLSDSSVDMAPSVVLPIPTADNGSASFGRQDQERVSFWKRKQSSGGRSPSNGFRRSMSANRVPSQCSSPTSVPGLCSSANAHECEEIMHDRFRAVLRDLDRVVSDFNHLIVESKQRRITEKPALVHRHSVDSQEFFDAEEGEPENENLLIIRRDSHDYDDQVGVNEESIANDSVSTSDTDGEEERNRTSLDGRPLFFPAKAKNIAPLPCKSQTRRETIPPASDSPPSLISLLRKNVGRDIVNSISMPIASNEPLSLLQRQAETMEYSELLDAAAVASPDAGERLLYVAAFAVSPLSANRQKERSLRKPFNPMLGETFELVREDKGFRFLAEKISHRPVRVACQAESNDWTFTQAAVPCQKFWGKSAELCTEGRARVVFHDGNDCYSWNAPTCFLRNIIAGEKYLEPVSTMTIVNQNSAATAVRAHVTFKAGGVFSGRSEDVTVEVHDKYGNTLPLALTGKWTSHLTLTSESKGHDLAKGRVIWKVGSMVPGASMRYGMTSFAASLNEITELERGKLAPTDTRLRPDQRAYEQGRKDEAERLKGKLEEAQRRRRKEREDSGVEWEPRWFRRMAGADGDDRHGDTTSRNLTREDDDDDAWCLKQEEEGGCYWEVRQTGQWEGIADIFGD